MGGIEGAQPLPCGVEGVRRRIQAAGVRLVRDAPGLSAEAFIEGMRPLEASVAATECDALVAEGMFSHHRAPHSTDPVNPSFETLPFDGCVGLLSIGRMAPDAIWPVVVPPAKDQ